MMNDIKKKIKEKKGFTLVELIVVLAILAVLAAVLTPTMLGWVDKAKDDQYILEARSVLMSGQAVISERYSKSAMKDIAQTGAIEDAEELAELNTLSDVEVTSFNVTDVRGGTNSSGNFTITGCITEFTSSDGTVVTATLKPGEDWTIAKSDGNL